MGCASSKKRTTSIDDLTAQKKEPLTGSSPKKNGQLAANDAKHKTKSTDSSKAIQIPGANKSFMAPDGIPFIDDDVDDDDGEISTTRPVSGTAVTATSSKSDVNRNVVSSPTPRPAGDVSTHGIESRMSSSAASDRPQTTHSGVVADIKQREMELTRGGGGVSVSVEQVVVTTTSSTAAAVTVDEASHQHSVVNGVAEPTVADQQRAAVKIQAGIRGYRDRQRVKELRAARQPTGVVNGDADISGDVLDSAGAGDDAEMDRAAVKIQASYKGYKTRKQLGKI